MTKLKALQELCSDLSLNEISDFRAYLYDLYQAKYNFLYKEVVIHPGERIEEKITKETGFKCFHKVPMQEYFAGRGRHVIVIPKEQYTEELEKELKNKYDDKW